MTEPAGSDRQLRPWHVIAAASIGMFLVNLDFFALNLALPRIAIGLHTTSTDLQWVISGYMLAFGALLIPAGRLGDIFGRRKMLVVGLCIFGAASALCGSASSAGFLIAARGLQGIGGVLLYPMSVAVLTHAFPPERRRWALGNLYGLAALGTAAGPFIGGAVTEHLGWRWVFFLNIPLAAVAVGLVLAYVGESRDETVSHRVDGLGLLLVSAGIVGITLAVDRGEDWGWTSATTLLTFALGLVLLAAFVFTERRVREPLVNLALFRNRPYVLVSTAGAAANIAYSTMLYLSTLYLQEVRGRSPLVAGVVFLAPAFGATLAGPLAGRLAGVVRPAVVMATAIGLGGIGLLLLSSFGDWWLYVPMFGLSGLGFGLGWAYTSVGTQEVVPVEEAGEAAGVTLAIVIGIAGFAVTLAATSVELLQSAGHSEGHSINLALRAIAIGSLVVAAGLASLRAGRARDEMVEVAA